jgi:hypothetical protein
MKATLLFIRADMILPAPEGDAVWPGDTGLTLRTTNVAIRGFSLRHTIADGTNTSYLFLECAQFLRCALMVKAYPLFRLFVVCFGKGPRSEAENAAL